MKKIIVSIVALVYLSTSTGAMLHMHYCMGKMADWSLGHTNSKTCAGCGMELSQEEDNGCCKDELKFIKNDADQKTAETGFQRVQLLSVALPVSFIVFPPTEFFYLTAQNPEWHAPSRSSGVAVYIRNCVYLI